MTPVERQELAGALRRGDRAALARAITLVESTRPDRRAEAAALLESLGPSIDGSIRIAVTGVPGVGKSTLIDALGSMLTAAGRKVAVLAVDPSSTRSGGAILGDKTRMARLSVDPHAFVRPSPTSGTLGGVAEHTRETIGLCEAAGFDVVVVETVGVGQSEIAAAEMVDLLLLLMLPGAGDEMQGIKKGIIEVADILAVNKADGENRARAESAAAELRMALGIIAPVGGHWTPPVLTVSAESGAGLFELWGAVERFRHAQQASGAFGRRRADQNVRWMWSILDAELRRTLLAREGIAAAIAAGEAELRRGERSPAAVAADILHRFST